MKRVRSLLGSLEVETVPTTCFRMGSTKDGQPRLLKIVLPASRFVFATLKRSHVLKDLPEWKGIYIRKSLTQQQRAEQGRMREFLRELRKGDSNCPFVLYRDAIWHR